MLVVVCQNGVSCCPTPIADCDQALSRRLHRNHCWRAVRAAGTAWEGHSAQTDAVLGQQRVLLHMYIRVLYLLWGGCLAPLCPMAQGWLPMFGLVGVMESRDGNRLRAVLYELGCMG